jgi:hypothetical protein
VNATKEVKAEVKTEAKVEPEFVMPQPWDGEIVLVRHGGGAWQPGVVLEIGTKTISANVFSKGVPPIKFFDGIRHQDDPVRPSRATPMEWDFTEQGRLLRKLAGKK